MALTLDQALTGISGILVTPYDAAGEIAPQRLVPIIDRALGAGLHMPVVNGNTGEFYALTTDEACAMATEVAGIIAGRAPLLAGVGRSINDAVALARASLILGQLKPENEDQKFGIEIVRRAVQSPLRQIAENAGVDGAVVAGKVRESDDKTFGFNAQTEEYGDMFKFGVIDPAKVVRTALEDAASVAGLLITTEAMIAEKPEPKAAAGGMGGGMGGMDF